MPLIRHRDTLVERNVPEASVRYFPDYDVVEEPSEAPVEDTAKSTRESRRPAAASTEQE